MHSQEPSRAELVREFFTMALYIALSLLAVTLVAPTTGDGWPAAATMLLTALGLVLAHLLAFAMSSRLVSGGLPDLAGARLLGVQAIAGAAVALLATLPVLVLPNPLGLQVAGVMLFVIIAVVGYWAARHSGASVMRSLVYVAVVAVLVCGVLAVKTLVH